MKEYALPQLGYFTESECIALKNKMDGKTFLKFNVSWSNNAGNCTLVFSTDIEYEDTPENITNFFIHTALSELAEKDEKEHDDKVEATLDSVWDLLPHEPSNLWTKSKGDDEILCKDERTAEGIADLIDALYRGKTTNTGYYDPEEDERNNEVNERTGYYYVTIN